MYKNILTAMAVVVLGTAFAFGAADPKDRILTSQTYVDAIVGALANSMKGTAGTVVVRDNSGDPTGEVGILDDPDDYNANTNADNLVTAGFVADAIDGLDIPTTESIVNDIPTLQMSKLTCANADDCTLWDIETRNVLGTDVECSTNLDCTNFTCTTSGDTPRCNNGVCGCVSL